MTAAVVMFGNKIIPALNKFSLFYLQIGWLVVLVTVVACAPSYQSPKFVFATWINNTGWNNQAICFITGLVNPLYSLGGLDGITHITEEMPNVSCNPFYYCKDMYSNKSYIAFSQCTHRHRDHPHNCFLHRNHIFDRFDV